LELTIFDKIIDFKDLTEDIAYLILSKDLWEDPIKFKKTIKSNLDF